MLDDTTAGWWYEQDGQQAGPVTAAALGRLVADGRLGPAHRVWRDGMAGWAPLASVPELAEALQAARPAPPAPPPLSAPSPFAGPSPFGRPGLPPGAGPGPAGASAAGGAPGAPWGGAVPGPATPLEEISPATVILLSILTFGIYGLVKFHQTGKGYEALAGRASTFSRNFWLFVGLGIASVFVNAGTGFLGVPLSIASLVFQVMTLLDALALRDDAIGRAGIRPEVTPAGTHKVLFIAGVLLSMIVVGLVLLVVQAVKWFSDWNAVRAALDRGRTGAAAPLAGAGR